MHEGLGTMMGKYSSQGKEELGSTSFSLLQSFVTGAGSEHGMVAALPLDVASLALPPCIHVWFQGQRTLGANAESAILLK